MKYSYHIKYSFLKPNFRRPKKENAIVLLESGAGKEHSMRIVSQELDKHMLPHELSNGICSLNERVDRLTLSVFIEYDENFKRVGHKICESIINSKKRFTYDEVFAIFNGNQDVINKNKPFPTTCNIFGCTATQWANITKEIIICHMTLI